MQIKMLIVSYVILNCFLKGIFIKPWELSKKIEKTKPFVL